MSCMVEFICDLLGIVFMIYFCAIFYVERRFSMGERIAVVQSQNLASFRNVHCILGIDEAGRGPVLGPMVYGACAVLNEDSVFENLKSFGVDDSKALTEEKREQIFLNINTQCSASVAYALEVIPPYVISTSMLGRVKTSLNEISMSSAERLIMLFIEAGLILDHVYLDTVGRPEPYQQRLERQFRNLNITVSKKADSLYPAVSAASICAKVTRDRCLAEWKCPEWLTLPPTGIGSGYPGDPATKEFLAKCIDPVFGYPHSLVRFSWKTVDDLLAKHAVTVKWEDDEENVGAVHSHSLLNYFHTKDQSTSSKPIERHVYFRDRHLRTATTL